jgi:DNA polymerase elongation subunit (family B)
MIKQSEELEKFKEFYVHVLNNNPEVIMQFEVFKLLQDPDVLLQFEIFKLWQKYARDPAAWLKDRREVEEFFRELNSF